MTSRIKSAFKCQESFKEKFKSSSCLISISVGQPAHESEKFEATINLINISFNSCTLLVGDSLQRHTMAIATKENADSFYDLSIQEGDKWLQRNEKFYSKLKNLVKISRWDTWLNHANFSTQKNAVLSLIQNDISYHTSFDNTIHLFLRKFCQHIKSPETIDLQKAYHLCMNYLVEESTALCLWPELDCHFDVYPSLRNQAMSHTFKQFVLPSYPNLLHPIAIKFKKRKHSVLQEFQLSMDEGIIA